MAFGGDQLLFEWTPTFWKGWRECSSPYRQFKSERDRSLTVQALQLREADGVLEVGCGYGWISRALVDAAKIRWVGLDPSECMVGELRPSVAAYQTRALVGTAYHLLFAAESFDKVICTGVLMHVVDEFATLQEMV